MQKHIDYKANLNGLKSNDQTILKLQIHHHHNHIYQPLKIKMCMSKPHASIVIE